MTRKVLLTAATNDDWQEAFELRYKNKKFVKIKTWQEFKKYLMLSYDQENKVMTKLKQLNPASTYSFTDPDRDYLIIGAAGSCSLYDIIETNQNNETIGIEVKNCGAFQKNFPQIIFNEHWKLPNPCTPVDLVLVADKYRKGRLHGADYVFFVDENSAEYCYCDLAVSFHAQQGVDGTAKFVFDHTSWTTF